MQGSEEWIEQRRGILTASVIGQLITPKTKKVAANADSRSITNLLVAERITGYTEPAYISDDMLRGMQDELAARDLYAQHYKRDVRQVGFYLREEAGWRLGYSPDGVVGDDGLIEVKAPRHKEHLRTVLADDVPAQYMAQCQAALLVTGREWLDYISYSGGMPMWHTRVLPDPAWHEAITAAAEQFETTAAEMTADYLSKIANFPATVRSPDYHEMVI